MFRTNLKIVCYHGIVESIPDGYNSSGKHILVSEFEKQISFLARNLAIVTMRDIDLAAKGVGALPRTCAAITFDDGFLNNFEIAHPILQKYEVPATLYVATNFISGSRLIWTDELERLILEASTMPLTRLLNDEITVDLSTQERRYQTLKCVKKKLKSFSPIRRISIMRMLTESLRFEHELVRYPGLHNFLNWEHLKIMQNSGLWEIGAHTMSHNSLGSLLDHEVRYEIFGSIQKVTQELRGGYPPLFSYPEGQDRDIPSSAINILKESGLHSAPSAIEGMNLLSSEYATDYFKLHRYMVGFDGIAFPWRIR